MRTPPSDITSEACVLGAMVLDENARVAARAIVGPDDFYRPAHATICKAIFYAADHNLAPTIDIVCVKNVLEKYGKLQEVGGIEYLAAMIEGVPSTANAKHYAESVKRCARKRSAVIKASLILERAYASDSEPDELCRDFLEAAHGIFVTNKNTMTAAVAGQKLIDRLNAIERGELEPGISLGFPTIDRCSGGGLKPGQVVVIAAASSVGKSALSQCFVANIAQKKKIHIFSHEMTCEEVAQRFISIMGRINGLRVGRGYGLTEEDWTRINSAQGVLEQWGANVRITDLPLDVAGMMAEAKQSQLRGGLDLIVIDYLQITPSPEKTSLRERINSITLGCKTMAKQLGIPILLLSQLSRAHQKDNRPPEMHDLKESSNIEQDADGIIFLHRPDGTNPADNYYRVMANIAKWRMGQVTSWDRPIELQFTPRYAKFEEVTNVGTACA